jgi:hypothetical protein
MEKVFPFPPYPVQKQLMTAIHDTAAAGEGRVGIFGLTCLFYVYFVFLMVLPSESPTGTGKSLSIITSSLYWLTKTLLDTVGFFDLNNLTFFHSIFLLRALLLLLLTQPSQIGLLNKNVK